MTKVLTQKQAKFVAVVLKGLNAAQAAREAGFKCGTNDSAKSTGHALMRNPRVVAALEAERKQVMQAAQVTAQPAAVSPSTMTPRRLVASTAVVVGLVGAVIGGLALARSGRIGVGNGRRGAIMALLLGPIGLVIGSLVVATADGGLGTGNGLGGGVVAMIVGLIGGVFGGLGLVRSRRAA